LLPWTIALFAVAIATVATWKFTHVPASVPRVPVRFTVALPAGVTLPAERGAIAISRDGALVAFAGCRAGDCAIYLRPLSQPDPMLVNGTAGGLAPFFSPDGRSIGFFASGKLLTLSLGGGSPTPIADAAAALGGTWTSDGMIVFAGSPSRGLAAVPERGGGPQLLTRLWPGPRMRDPTSCRTARAWSSRSPDGTRHRPTPRC
jgi:serine/threonine-protein kinase